MNRVKKILQRCKKDTISYAMSNRLFISYVIISLLATLFARYLTLGKIFKFFPFVTDFGLILLIGAFGYFFKGKKQFIHYFLWICVYSMAGLVNTIYYQFYASFASFGELASLSQTKTVTGSVFEKLSVSYVIFLVLPMIFYFIHRKLNSTSYYSILSKVEKKLSMFLSTFIVSLIMLIISFSFATGTDYSRLSKQWNRSYIVERFGIILYQSNDLFQTLKPQITSLFGYEDAKEYFDNYFEKNKKEVPNNKYTNILEGKNVVFVHMESIQTFLMDVEFNGVEATPNLNKLASEGMFFENFYPEVSTGTSSDTEFTLLSSLMPASSGTVFVSYYDRNYNTIPKYLSAIDYKTFSMHGNYSSMWNRNKAHPSLGYQDMYFRESFDFTSDDVINLGINDKLFFKQAIPILEKIEDDNTNYMGTIITLSNHSPYQFMDKYGEYDMSTTYVDVDEKTGEQKEVITNYLEGKAVGNYIHSSHYADAALGEFLEYIKESDHFNDTVFVFYGDHDAKLSRSEMNYLYNYNYKTGETYKEGIDEEYTSYDQFDHELNKKTPLVIWTKNEKLKKVFKGKVDYYMGMIDVAPTILNMYGIFNEYALGNDIFTTQYNNVVPYPNGNFVTSNLYYNNSTGGYKIINNNVILDEQYITTTKNNVEDLLDVSNYIVTYDLLTERKEGNE